MTEKKRLVTPKARLSYPHLFRAQVNKLKPNSKPLYSVSLIFDEEAQQTAEFKALRDEVKRLAIETFGKKDPKTGQMVLPKTVKNPLRSGEDKEHLDGYGAGKVFMGANTQSKPRVVGLDLQPLREDEVYPGCFVVCSVVPATFDVEGSRGVKFYLNNVQKVADGDRLGGSSSSPEDDFGAPRGESAPAANIGPAPAGGFADLGGAAVDDSDLPF